MTSERALVLRVAPAGRFGWRRWTLEVWTRKRRDPYRDPAPFTAIRRTGSGWWRAGTIQPGCYRLSRLPDDPGTGG